MPSPYTSWWKENVIATVISFFWASFSAKSTKEFHFPNKIIAEIIG